MMDEVYSLKLKTGKIRNAVLLKNDLLKERVWKLRIDSSIVFDGEVKEAIQLDSVLSYLFLYMNI